MPRRPWSEEDEQKLVQLIDQGLTYTAIARKMDRTPLSIWSRVSRMRLGSRDLDGKVRQRTPRRAWTQEEADQAYELYKSGLSYEVIAKRMQRNSKNVARHIMLSKAGPERRAEIQANKAAYNKERQQARASLRAMYVFCDSDRIELDDELLRAREVRMSLMPRDLTGFLMGDPPVGLSALDQMNKSGDMPHGNSE